MVDLTSIRNPEPNPGAGENLPPVPTEEMTAPLPAPTEGKAEKRIIESTPSKDISRVIESLKTPADKAARRRGARAKGARKGKRPAKKARRKSGSKTAKKGARKKPAKRKARRKAKDLLEIPVVYEKPRRKTIPASLSNLLLFTVIFAILAIAQISIKIGEGQRIPLNFAPVEITAEEEVDITGSESIEAMETKPIGPEVVEPVGAQKVESAVIENAKATEKITEVEGTAKIIETGKKPRRRLQRQYYRSDPYTSGGPLDLDGSQARQKYLSGNIVKVPKASQIKPDGGDNSKNADQTATRENLQGGLEERR